MTLGLEEIKAIAASVAIGLSLGLIGAGGSVLTIPVFVYVLKKNPLSSAVYSMFVVASSSAIGSVRSISKKLVDFNVFFKFGIPSVLGVLIARRIIFPSIPMQLGSVATRIISKDMVFMLCLASAMLIAAISMLRSSSQNHSVLERHPLALHWLLLRGFAIGIVTGMLGIGGGFLIVPALYFLARLPMKQSIATALLIITVNATFGFLASFQSIDIDWSLLIKFSFGAVFGILIGTKLATRLSGNHLKKIFGFFILCVSLSIIYKQIFT